MVSSYAILCRAVYDGLVSDGHDRNDAGFNAKLCQRLRLFGGSTEIVRFETGGGYQDLECWRGTRRPVPEWFGEVRG